VLLVRSHGGEVPTGNKVAGLQFRPRRLPGCHLIGHNARHIANCSHLIDRNLADAFQVAALDAYYPADARQCNVCLGSTESCGVNKSSSGYAPQNPNITSRSVVWGPFSLGRTECK
jgi:hypothetical protein